MSGVRQQIVARDEDGMRLDRWFATHFPQVTFGHLQKLLRSGQVRVDGGRAKSDTRIEPGQDAVVVRIDGATALIAPSDRATGPDAGRDRRTPTRP